MSPIDASLFHSALSPQDLMDEALLGATVDPAATGSLGTGQGLEESPQEQADATLLSLTHASQAQLNTEAFYGVPASLLDIQQMVDTMVNSVSTSVTQYAATAETLSHNEVFDLLRA